MPFLLTAKLVRDFSFGRHNKEPWIKTGFAFENIVEAEESSSPDINFWVCICTFFPPKLLKPVPRLWFSYSPGLFSVWSALRWLCAVPHVQLWWNILGISAPLDILENRQRKKIHLELYSNVTVWSVYAAESIQASWDWLFVAAILWFFPRVPCQL